MTTITQITRTPFFKRRILLGLTAANLLLIGIMLLSLGLHLTNLSAIGDANTYYTAAVESMLDSWQNFFFVAAEPGGSVTVDKPPLGLWIEAAFAFVLGVSGVSVCLPNIIAGVLSVPVLYHLVKQHWGEGAGLIAGLALAVTPVAVATNRNNTMDGMLVFTLLLAAWCFLKATQTGRLRWLLLGAFLAGLGFNIKMLQAFLPLPAFYALYFFGAKTGLLRKLFNLGLATILLLVVSLSWAVIVDLTPADQRPYIGSSDNNTVMELILGHNGLSRLFNQRAGRDAPVAGASTGSGMFAQQPPLPSGAGVQRNPQPGGALPPAGQQPPIPGAAPGFQPPSGLRPPGGALADGPYASPNGGPSAGSTPFSQETGSPGIARFFSVPLSKQMSWLLPFGLLGLGVMLFSVRLRFPLEPEHQALILWGGWLLTCLVFFSSVEGIFHAYYVIMLAPALGAVVGAGFVQLWRWGETRRWLDGLLLVGVGATVAFQIYSALDYGVQSAWIYMPLLLLAGGAVLLLIKQLRPMAYLGILAALMLIPLAWTVLTVVEDSPNVNLPTAYEALAVDAPRVQGGEVPEGRNPEEGRLIAFLENNTQDVDYLLAVPNAHVGAPLVLETGRPVLYMGGFGGGDTVIDSAGLAEMVSDGQLRYVLLSGGVGNQREIAGWLASSCRVVPQFSSRPASADQTRQYPGLSGPRPSGRGSVLYECGS